MGSKPKAPPAPPDPAIAAEKARREAVAIGLADARRSARHGSAGTVLTQGNRPGTELTRPDQAIQSFDPGQTAAAQTQKQIAGIQESINRGDFLTTETVDKGDAGPIDQIVDNSGAARKQIGQLQESITPAEMATFNAAKKDKAIGDYINRTRTRVGVKSTTRATA